MQDIFTIELPPDVPEQELDALEAEVRRIDEVEDAGPTASRAIDPAAIGLWIETAGGILASVGTAIPVIEKVLALVRGRGIQGAKITFADENGAPITIEAERASARELERLISAARSTSSPSS